MKPMNYLREEGEESNAYLQRLIKHYSSQEIYEERLNLLAKEWKTRYMKQINLIGKHKASTWWRDIVESMEKKRGKAFVDNLRLRMNKLKETK
jgi:CHASE3 domain sensor protein